MSNQINVIYPYLYKGLWVFDDKSKGLDKEPFVGGMDVMIEMATRKLNIINPDLGFCVIFSKDEFPGYDLVLKWIKPETSGNIYEWVGTNQQGWLCPALLKYFPEAPKSIYIKMQSNQQIVRQYEHIK